MPRLRLYDKLLMVRVTLTQYRDIKHSLRPGERFADFMRRALDREASRRGGKGKKR